MSNIAKKVIKDSITKSLLYSYQDKGYILINEIIDISMSWGLSVQEIDKISQDLLLKGVLIYEEEPIKKKHGSVNDYAKTDYQNIYDEIIWLDNSGSLRHFIDKVSKIHPPQRGEFKRLIILAKNGNQFAKDRIIEMYIRLALKIALQRAKLFDTDISETISDALAGLVFAYEKYDPNSKKNFSTFAYYCILDVIEKNRDSKRPLISYPIHRIEQYNKIYSTIKEQLCFGCPSIYKCRKIRKLIIKELKISETATEELIPLLFPITMFSELNYYREHVLGKHETVEEIVPNGFLTKPTVDSIIR